MDPYSSMPVYTDPWNEEVDKGQPPDYDPRMYMLPDVTGEGLPEVYDRAQHKVTENYYIHGVTPAWNEVNSETWFEEHDVEALAFFGDEVIYLCDEPFLP